MTPANGGGGGGGATPNVPLPRPTNQQLGDLYTNCVKLLNENVKKLNSKNFVFTINYENVFGVVTSDLVFSIYCVYTVEMF